MFDYKFITIASKSSWRIDYDVDYKNMIQDNSADGWRFVQLVPVSWTSYGVPNKLELVLERPNGWEEDIKMKTV